MKQNRKGILAIKLRLFCIASLALLTLQSCSKFQINSKLGSAQLADFSSSGGPSLQPATDRVDAKCMSKPEFNACLFQKNPVVSYGKAFAEPVISASVGSLQTYGVRLTGVLPTGRLENSTILIDTIRGTAVTTNTQDLRYTALNDGNQKYTQIATYYWLNRTIEYLSARTGTLPAKGKKVTVYVDDTIAGWSPRTNSIHLRIGDDGNPMAWGPELAVHFFGVANLHHATNGAISAISATTHRDCGSKANGCCTSSVGCARAIASGVGDYFAAMIFPDRPTVGETWSNSLGGIALCGLDRNLNSAATRTADAAFKACETAAVSGDVNVLGTIYASVWWQVRKSAIATKPTADQDIDTIFMHHLALLDGADTFSTTLSKVKSVDQRLFSGRYSALFEAEFKARGL